MKEIEFYFKDSFFNLKLFDQILARVVLAVLLILFVFTALFFLTSDSPVLLNAGILFSLLVVDTFSRRDKGRFPLDRLPKEGRVNIADYLTPQSLEVLAAVYQRALILGGGFYLRLTAALLELPEVSDVFERLDVEPKEFKQKINEYLKRPPVKESPAELTAKIESLAKNALLVALKGNSRYIASVDLLAAEKDAADKDLARLFGLFEIAPRDLEGAIIFGRFRKQIRGFVTRRLPQTIGGFAGSFFGLRHRVMNRAWTARPTPTLDMFGTDFTDLARAGQAGFLIGHQNEYNRLVDILSRPNKPNVILVGEAGIGKETVISHLAYMITKDKAPEQLFDKRLVALNISSLVSGADQAELQRRIAKIFEEIAFAQNIILYVPEIHNLSRTSGEFYLSAANIMLPLIISNDFPTIGTTYPGEFREYIKKDSVFMEAFEFITVEELSEEEATKLLVYSSLIFEAEWRIAISFSAVKTAVYLAKKYFHSKPLPSSADDLLKEALADAKRRGIKRLTKDEIVGIAERRTNIPIHQVGRTEASKLLNLEQVIHEDLIDQEEAVSAVSRALREYRSGLTRGGGPIAAFLFVGPTGVGKTELAKILTKTQFGSEEMMARLDMSEYQDKTSFFRLIGSPDGKVVGALTEAVLEKPYSLVLLDEFEKAHPDVLNLFLQVFDDGRLTDNLGRTVDFKNTIIIATSNAHSAFIKASLDEGKTIESISEEFKKKLVDYFKPELLNRFSDIIIFKTLSMENIKEVVKLQIKKFASKLLEDQGIDLTFDDETLLKIAELGYDPVFGARPLRKVISQEIKGPLSEKILKEEIGRGSRIFVKTAGDQLEFKTV